MKLEPMVVTVIVDPAIAIPVKRWGRVIRYDIVLDGGNVVLHLHRPLKPRWTVEPGNQLP